MTEKQMTPSLRRILAMAQLEAERDRSEYVAVQHLLTAMHQEGKNVGAHMMQEYGLTLEKVRNLQFGITVATPNDPSSATAGKETHE